MAVLEAVQVWSKRIGQFFFLTLLLDTRSEFCLKLLLCLLADDDALMLTVRGN